VPFPDGSAVEKMMAHQTQEPEPIQKYAPDVPKGLAEIVARLMAKKPEERYGGCDQVAEALEQFVGDARAVTTAPAAGSARAAIQSSRQLTVPSSRGGSAGRMPPVAEKPPSAKSSNLGVRVPTPPPLPSSIPPGNRTPGPPPDRKPAPLPTRASTNRNDDLPPMAEEIDEGANLPVTRPVVSRQSARGMPVQAPARVAPGRTAPSPGRAATAAKPVTAAKGAPAARASAAKVATSGAGAIPANWVDEDPDGKPVRSFGPIGMIAAALLLMVIVYLGATVLMKQQ
jgi:serine/threonine-protein kinase